MNNRTHNIILSAMMMVLLLGSYSCNDFLNEPPRGSLDEQTLANQNGVEGNLISAYALLDGYNGQGRLWTSAGSNWVLGAISADNSHKGSESGDQQGLQDLELYQWSLGNADQQLNDKWEILYEGISRTNSTLRQLAASADEISSEDQARIRGEAFALRALYHFEAYKVWENVPFVPEDAEDFDIANTEPIIPIILSDLDNAIQNLPPAQDDVGRVTQWAAKALKGKVLLYDGQFSEALTELRDVVNNGPFQLENNFWQVFSATNDNGPETIIAFQASVNDGNPAGDNGNRQDRLNFPHSGSPFGCCGFFQPSQNLVNAYQVDANGLPLPLTSPNNWNNLEGNPDASVPVDPRLDWTVGRPGVPFLDWGIQEVGWIRDSGFAGIYTNKKNIWEQFSNAKSSVGWSTFQLHWKNMHILRYADVLLMLAEAEVEAGSLENARNLVNQIRTRAAQAAQGPDGGNIEVPIDDPNITWANYQIGTYDQAWTDQTEARRAVRIERRLELAQEGHRLFDLRRWNQDQDVLNSYLQVEQGRRPFLESASPLQERHDRYPIPSEQLDLTNELQQNPGW